MCAHAIVYYTVNSSFHFNLFFLVFAQLKGEKEKKNSHFMHVDVNNIRVSNNGGWIWFSFCFLIPLKSEKKAAIQSQIFLILFWKIEKQPKLILFYITNSYQFFFFSCLFLFWIHFHCDIFRYCHIHSSVFKSRSMPKLILLSRSQNEFDEKRYTYLTSCVCTLGVAK